MLLGGREMSPLVFIGKKDPKPNRGRRAEGRSKVGEREPQQKCVVYGVFFLSFFFCQKPFRDALFFYETISAPPNLTVPRCCGAACCCCGRCCGRRGCPSKEPHRLRATVRTKRGSQGARPIAANLELSRSRARFPSLVRRSR